MPQPKLAKDARRDQRVPARLQIELTLDEGSPTQAESTLNISANGVYFRSRRFIEPLTVLGLRILLPGERGGAQETLDVRGVVVRIDPEEPRAESEGYEVACYFMDSTPEFRERLGKYVQANL
jgi:hypothetical protein